MRGLPGRARAVKVDLELSLVEEAVWLALRDEAADAFHVQREALYEIADAEDRDRAFSQLSLAWFGRLGLRRLLETVLAERPRIAQAVALCTVSRATRAREEGAELYVQPHPKGPAPEDRRLHIRLRPETLVDAPAARSLLRSELLHVADMLDPAFGYEPRLSPSDAGPTHDRLLLERYGALWSTTVAGRLVRAGMLPPTARGAALSRFASAFPALAGSESPFERFFCRERPTHVELVEFAQAPDTGTSARSGTWRCPLCACPVQDSRGVPDDALAVQIRRDFPSWQPEAGACLRCRELYEPAALPQLG
jgi:hypothetical protein